MEMRGALCQVLRGTRAVAAAISSRSSDSCASKHHENTPRKNITQQYDQERTDERRARAVCAGRETRHTPPRSNSIGHSRAEISTPAVASRR